MYWNIFKSLNYKLHILIAAAIRFLLIAYGVYHDENFAVPYTDVDYKVFTDASRHILEGRSPYDRHTFRYSPLISFIVIPNITLHHCFGKILFSIIDLILGLLIRAIVKDSLKEYERYNQNLNLKYNDSKLKIDSDNALNNPSFKYVRQRKRSKNMEKYDKRIAKFKPEHELQADISMMLWLYNPLTIGISTRGNSDSLAGVLVLLTIYFLQCQKKYFIAGLVHGVSIHFRLYPLIYSLGMFMYLSSYSFYSKRRFEHFENQYIKKLKEIKTIENQIVHDNQKEVMLTDVQPERKTIFKKKYILYLIPNLDQLQLITGCLITLCSLTSLFYYLYGYKFLYETYIYHLIRKDTRHNFSIYFYLQYLTAGVKNIGLWQKILIALPQFTLLLVFSIRYGLNKFTLNFCILTTTITMVAYNSVLTSQYFVWVLVVLPLCIWQIKMTRKTTIFLIFIWFAAQAAWLMSAYFLEFRGQNTFLFIWLQSVSFFCANIAILGRLIMNYMPSKHSKVL